MDDGFACAEKNSMHGHFRPGIQGCVHQQRAGFDVAIEADQSSFLVFNVQRGVNRELCGVPRSANSAE